MNFKFGEKPNALEIKNIKPEAKELIAFAKKYGNPLVFEDFGLDEEPELIENIRVKNKVLEGLSEEDMKSARFDLKVFKSFLRAPIFTDSFHEDHYSRRIWENNNLQKISVEAQEYYKNNRLGINTCFSVIGFLSDLEDLVVNLEVRDKLLNFKQNIPHELFDKNKEGILRYNSFDDNEKIRVAKELTKVTEDLILFLEEKLF